MLSAISWVPRGAAKPFPKTAELDEEEVAEVRRRAEGAAAAAAAVAGGAGGDADAEDGEENDEDAAMEEEEEEEGSEEEGEADGEEAAAAAAALAAEIRKAKKGQSADDRLADELAELDMDHYDDEADAAPNLFGTGKGVGAAYYRSNDEDPYLTKAEGAEDEDDEDEIEDLTIRDTDLLILAARNEDDVSFIEVWVCEEQQKREEGEDGDDVAQNDKELNMYVHHDIMLPAFPLALAWMDFNPSAAAAAAASSSSAGATAAVIAAAGAGASVLAPGNFVAVATMDPAIEIWDLDVLDEVEPAASLGGFVTTAGGAGGDAEEEEEEEWEEVEEEMEMGGGGSGSKKGSKGKKGKKDKGGKKGKKGREREQEKRGSSNKKGKSQGKSSAAAVLKEGSHKGAVMALSWNREYRSVLASGGEDRRVKVWDMAAQRCDRTLKPHTGKVQAVAWAPLHATSLLSGSFDRSLALRCDRTLKPHTGKVQAVAWAPLHATSLLSGLFDRSLALVSKGVVGHGGSSRTHGTCTRCRRWPGRPCTPPYFDFPCLPPLTAPWRWWVLLSRGVGLALIDGRPVARCYSAAVGCLCGLTYPLPSCPHSPPPPLLPPSARHPLPSQTDVRSPDATVLRWGVSADVEALAWDPHESTRFVVSSEDGLICCHDTRAGSSNATAASSASPVSSFPNALFTIHAHTKAACTVSWNPKVPNLLASGSTDKTVKLWDLTGNQARCLESSNPKLGAVFSVAFCADAPGFLAMGGSKGKLKSLRASTPSCFAFSSPLPARVNLLSAHRRSVCHAYVCVRASVRAGRQGGVGVAVVADRNVVHHEAGQPDGAPHPLRSPFLFLFTRLSSVCLCDHSATSPLTSAPLLFPPLFPSPSPPSLPPLRPFPVSPIIDQQLRTQALPIDSSAQYLVLTSADVALGDREKGFCGRSGYCGFHSFATDGVSYIKYAFIGEKCGTRCMRTGGRKRTPNGKRGVDGMISIVGHEMVETASNPRIEGGWYDALGAESSDKCMTDFGPSVSVGGAAVALGGSGYSYNMVGQGGMQWLVESNWRPVEPQGYSYTMVAQGDMQWLVESNWRPVEPHGCVMAQY
ncbi:unnamed protein product [Closterium sp. Naga37s-1]|nr:unnamed protein product [Closterium sp. Naga37s-1]